MHFLFSFVFLICRYLWCSFILYIKLHFSEYNRTADILCTVDTKFSFVYLITYSAENNFMQLEIRKGVSIPLCTLKIKGII
jgi:hypothetical protein